MPEKPLRCLGVELDVTWDVVRRSVHVPQYSKVKQGSTLTLSKTEEVPIDRQSGHSEWIKVGRDRLSLHTGIAI